MSTQKKIIIIVAVVIAVLVVIKVIGALNRKSEIEELSMPTEMMLPETETVTVTPETETQPAEMTPATNVQPEIAAPAAVSLQMTPLNIQKALQAAGFDPGVIDGKIGRKTKQAIIDFQKANNLTADGKVGPKTWAKLSSYLSSGQ